MISRPQRTLLRIEYLVIAVLLAFVLSTPSAFAAQFIVSTSNVDGVGSLRQAVRDANSNGNPEEVDLIIFSPSVEKIILWELDFESTGSIHVTESLEIRGPGQKKLIIDGDLYWMTSDGIMNGGYPGESTSTWLGFSGILFDVGLRDTDNSAIKFTVSGLTVTRTAGVVMGRGGATVVLDDVWIKENGYMTQGPTNGALLINVEGNFHIRNSFISGNKAKGPLILSDGITLIEGVTSIANSNKFEMGIFLAGEVGEIRNSEIGDYAVQHILNADKTCLTNTVFKAAGVPFYALVSAEDTELYMNHTTIYSPGIRADFPVPIYQPSHLWLINARLHMANSVISDDQLAHTAAMKDMFFMEGTSAIVLNANNHVSDGTLPGAASGIAGIEQSVIHDGAFKPVLGSALIDAGDDAHAVNACSGAALDRDILGHARKSGPSVDIGAVEVKEDFAVNDTYYTGLNQALLVEPPGLLVNDILEGTPLFINDGLLPVHTTPVPTPEHGTLKLDGLFGGMLYTPNAGYIGLDFFYYRVATGTFEDSLISNKAKVTIVVERPPPSRIMVDKVTAPVGDPQVFDFSLTGGPDSISQSFSLSDTSVPYDSGDISAGTYSLTETPVDGWVTHVSCDNGNDDFNSIEVGFGETVTCTVTNTELDSVVVNLSTVPPGGAGFGFTHDIGAATPFTLDDTQSKHFDSVVAGTYTITQDDPGPEYALLGIECTGAATFVPDKGNRKVTMTMEPGETANCEFLNVKSGRILVKKETNPEGESEYFDFELTGSYSFQQTFDLKDGQTYDSGLLKVPSIYNLVETVPAGWQQTSAVCDDGSDPTHIEVNLGETVTCTVTNTKDDHVVVSLLSFAGNIENLGFTHNIGDGTPFTLDNYARQQFEAVANGDYTITQDDPSAQGFVLSEITCTGSFTNLITDLDARRVSFTLGSGQAAGCLFLNREPGEIIVDLVTSPPGDQQPFEFKMFGPDTLNHGFLMTDEGPLHSSGHIAPGAYHLSPVAPDGWQLDSITCDDGSQHGDIELMSGETVTCTVTQSLIPTPRFTFTKNGVRNGDRIEYTISWENTGDADAVGSILSDVLPAGTSFISANGGGVYDGGTNTVSWDLGTIAVGSDQQSVALVLGADIDAVISNEAFISFNQDRRVVAKTTVYGEGIFKDSFETP